MWVLIVGESVAARDVCRQTALRLGIECGGRDCVSPQQLRLRLTREPAPQFVFVVVQYDEADGNWNAVRYAADQADAPVIVIGPAENVPLRDKALAAGATDYIAEAQLRDFLMNATAKSPTTVRSGLRRGRAICVFGMQPGAGVTTVATGLAFALASKDRQVSLIEFCESTPDLALTLDLNPKHSIAELIKESDRMDASMLRNAAVHHADGVDILAYPPETMNAEPVSARAVEDFLVLSRSSYDWSVFDLGHGVTEANELSVLNSDLTVIVTRMDIPGLRLTRALIKTLNLKQVPHEKLMIVANHYGQSGQMPWRKFEEALRTPVNCWLPDDPASLNKAVNAGVPLARSRWSKVSREFQELAQLIQTRVTATVH